MEKKEEDKDHQPEAAKSEPTNFEEKIETSSAPESLPGGSAGAIVVASAPAKKPVISKQKEYD